MSAEALVIPDVTGLSLPEAAVAYTEAGWAVGPLWWMVGDDCACGHPEGSRCASEPKNRAKHPIAKPGIVPKGLSDFSDHTAQVAGWWRRHPKANIGLLPPPGYFALDIDDPPTWKAQELHLPDAGPWQYTGSGGDHCQLVYRLPGDGYAINTPIAGTGAETKGDGGGYIVVPPSVTRGAYTWGRTGPVPVAPDELLAILPRQGERAANTNGVPSGACARCILPDRIPRDPGGHAWLAGHAAHLKAAHGIEGEASRAILRSALPRMGPPYPHGAGEAEVDKVIAYDLAHPERIERGGRVILTSAPGIDAADLLAMDLPPLRMIVPGLLPEGTAVLVAPPKVGKSCLVYQVAVEVSLGGELFGERVVSGSALYLALEDGLRRGQDRLRAALAGRTLPRGRLEVRWTAPRIGEGLEQDIAAWLDAHEDAALVAIDTLGRVKPRGHEKSNAYDLDVDLIGRLQSLFRDRPVALVLVHHVNKGSHDDFVAQVSGTYGVGGSVDTIINIDRKRAEAFGTINVTGRDIEDGRLSVRFTGMTWSAAPGALAEASFSRTEVYRAIEELGPVFPKAVADRLGLERSNVQHRIEALVQEGAVERTAGGYRVAGLLTIPHHSSHSESDGSDWVHTRAREDGQPDDTPWPEEPPSDPDAEPDNLVPFALDIFGDLLEGQA